MTRASTFGLRPICSVSCAIKCFRLQPQPIAQPNAELLGPFHALDARSQFRTEQSAVGSLVGQAPYGGQAHIDGCRREKSRLQFDPVAQNDMFAKGPTRLGASQN